MSDYRRQLLAWATSADPGIAKAAQDKLSELDAEAAPFERALEGFRGTLVADGQTFKRYDPSAAFDSQPEKPLEPFEAMFGTPDEQKRAGDEYERRSRLTPAETAAEIDEQSTLTDTSPPMTKKSSAEKFQRQVEEAEQLISWAEGSDRALAEQAKQRLAAMPEAVRKALRQRARSEVEDVAYKSGRRCAACGRSNGPRARHCAQCASPL